MNKPTSPRLETVLTARLNLLSSMLPDVAVVDDGKGWVTSGEDDALTSDTAEKAFVGFRLRRSRLRIPTKPHHIAIAPTTFESMYLDPEGPTEWLPYVEALGKAMARARRRGAEPALAIDVGADIYGSGFSFDNVDLDPVTAAENAAYLAKFRNF